MAKKINTDNLADIYSPIEDKRQSLAVHVKDNIEKYSYSLMFYRWNLDLFADLFIRGEAGRRLHHDQRVFLRVIGRFYSVSAVFARSYSKTFLEVLGAILVGILYPNIKLALSAQTQQNAASILKDKYNDILDFFPGLKDEIVKTTFNKDGAEITLANGSAISVLANSQSSKGQRRNRLSIEESALMDTFTYEDVMQPIVDNPRAVNNKLGIANPLELNRQINFFTTAYYRASNEFKRVTSMLNGMLDCKGEFVIGSDWRLNAWYGRGANKPSVQKNKNKTNPVSFAMNYESHFVGVSEDALVDISKLIATRKIDKAEYEATSGCEYYMGVDVARRRKQGTTQGNQTSVSICKVHRKANNRVSEIEMPFIITVLGDEKFEDQAIKIKKIAQSFNIMACIIDANGLTN